MSTTPQWLQEIRERVEKVKLVTPTIPKAVCIGSVNPKPGEIHLGRLVPTFIGECGLLLTLLEQAVEVIERGIELMPLHHLGQWEGVRGFIETVKK